jgi:hypothetical protein
MKRILNDREINTILHALRSMAANAREGAKYACQAPASDHFAEGKRSR